MPPTPPPATAQVDPARAALPAGTVLWRVHRGTRSAETFNPVPADGQFGGGRFDATRDDPYPFLYAGFRPETALLESLVRSVPFNERGVRHLRRAALTGLVLSSVRTTADLDLISLRDSAELAAACQDEWLVTADPPEYPRTRRWGHWLRDRADWGQGLIWPSRRDLGNPAAVLFGDRTPPGLLKPGDEQPLPLDDAAGAAHLNALLAPFRIHVRPPRNP
ncbi:RES domain-containing protein [Actinomadura sp. GC306]|uniref:RES family NAD+ phosphorylase n=1 Tax=Actinomadura sp. GC306 TaxID=2530367 RepID=UPI0010514DEB|nr:RES family NAD+ phosphorylase [Actinomadura sp. GC306]TDC70793.1 RES domain-containing protein [Actinomadura sp. GC306]